MPCQFLVVSNPPDGDGLSLGPLRSSDGAMDLRAVGVRNTSSRTRRKGQVLGDSGRGSHALPVVDRISMDPDVCGGKPAIRGLRVTVDFVLKLLADGYTARDIVENYPELEEPDVYAAARYG